MKKIKAIVFDLDDTLFLENLFRRSGFNFIAKKLNRAGISVTSKKIFQMSKQYPKTLFNEIVFRYHLSYSPEDLLGWYRNHPPKIRAYPGVKLLLKRLKREYKLGLLTDYFHQTQVNKVKALGIGKFFDSIVYTDNIRAPKPATLGFRILKEKFGCQNGQIIYIGDNEEKDFVGAKKAGFITVKFKNQKGFFYGRKGRSPMHNPHFEIKGLKDVFKILAQLNCCI